MKLISRYILPFSAILLFVGAALLLTNLFWTIFQAIPALLFFVSISLTAWLYGRNVGFIASFLSVCVINVFLFAPQFVIDLSYEGLIRSTLIFAVGLTLSWLTTAHKKSELERSRLNVEIENQRRRLSDIISSVPGVVWEAWGQPDKNSQRIDFINDYVETMLGYTIEEWLAQPNFWLTIVHPDDKEEAARRSFEHFSKGGADTNTFRWVKKDGSEIWIESHSIVITDEAGKPIGMRGVTLDISERKEAEKSIKISEKRFRKLVEQSPISTQVFSADGRTILTNSAWEKLWGVTLADLPDYNILEDEQLVERGIMPYIKKAFEGTPTTIPSIPYYPDRGDFINQPRWVEAFIYPVKDEQNRVREVVLMHEDITERKEIEKERELILEREQAARLKAEEANRVKDEFLATLSHELRTPLTAILGWSQMLSNGSLDEETVKYAIEVIGRNARNQSQLINDILDVSRIITGKLRVAVKSIEIKSVVESAIEAVQISADLKNININFKYDDSIQTIKGDADRLQQVFWNLLSNAIKFTPQGGAVKIEAEKLTTHVRVSVSDTGQGIEPEFLPYVFDRFRQADGSSTRQHGGLGLGLAIVRHLVEIHGGTVSVASEGVGKGSTFIVDLPLNFEMELPVSESENSFPQETAQNLSLENKTALPLNNCCILLIEDDPDSLELVTFQLEQSGASVTRAASSPEALEIFKTKRFDVLISDIGMPDENGYEFIRKVRALDAENGGLTPAIALTAYASSKDRSEALEAGFQTHLAKPVDKETLIVAVSSLIEGQKLLSN
jgi:PAS domain S-box-containing protein